MCPKTCPFLPSALREPDAGYNWKISTCREGAREAWEMVKTHCTTVETAYLAEVGSMDPDGNEVPTSLVYDNVMPAARFSQADCALDSLIDRLDKM